MSERYNWIALPAAASGWLDKAERRLLRWLHDRQIDRVLARCGGVQVCPWCNTCAQLAPNTRFVSTPEVDELHCGNCGGVSRWRFELGMIGLEPIGLTPPPVPTIQAREIEETEE